MLLYFVVSVAVFLLIVYLMVRVASEAWHSGKRAAAQPLPPAREDRRQAFRIWLWFIIPVVLLGLLWGSSGG